LRETFPPPWSVEEQKACIGLTLLRPLTDFIELYLAHEIRVDYVDNLPQVSAATAETSPYFSGEFLSELGALIFTTYCLQVASSL
jgi:hypothetical protein